MKNDNTKTTEPTTLNEPELENVNGGAINLDAFITVLNGDRLRHTLGMDRPKGIFLPTNIADVRTNIASTLAVNIKATRGL
jgi:hypothetical protein